MFPVNIGLHRTKPCDAFDQMAGRYRQDFVGPGGSVMSDSGLHSGLGLSAGQQSAWSQTQMMMSSVYNIVSRLRAEHASFSGLQNNNKGLLKDAADEIERLRSRVSVLEQQKSPEGQREIGYAQAQKDMRRALGIDD